MILGDEVPAFKRWAMYRCASGARMTLCGDQSEATYRYYLSLSQKFVFYLGAKKATADSFGGQSLSVQTLGYLLLCLRRGCGPGDRLAICQF
jgi:hypothetical protein